MATEAQLTITKLRNATGRSVRRLALTTLARLIVDPRQGGTPVDTRHAQTNWVLSVGNPYTRVDGTKEAISEGAQRAGAAKVERWRLGQPQIFLTNNVPYVSLLNQGSSKQAPAGFVEAAVQAALDKERVIRDLERAVGGGR
jgi:hypothetical protein